MERRIKTVFNWTNEDFTHTWNKEPYTIPVGKSMRFEEGIADTFAYHMAIGEMNKKKQDHGRVDILNTWVQKALVEAPSAPISQERADIELMQQEQPVADEPKKKAGRPKKVVEPVEETVSEEKFEGVENA